MTSNSNTEYTGSEDEAGSAVQSCPQETDPEEPPKPTHTIRIGMFFDGTLNNRTNVTAGKAKRAKGEEATDDSYGNDYSNVSKLEKYWETNTKYDHSFSLYIEGIGTEDNESDSNLIGAAFGMRTTGIPAKVEKGITYIIKKIDTLGINKDETIEHVHLDAFGFSRGAAAARHFCYASIEYDELELLNSLKQKGYIVNEVSIKFVGLYDTVASYGADHDNDTADLHLDSISCAERVIQLAAAEEHRENFRLTNINSASSGFEIFLPGVHSDVGGGYRDNTDETDLQILDVDRTFGLSDEDEQKFADERQWLIDSGWYKESEIQEVNFWNELKVTRKGIGNKYDRIPLRLMADFAEKLDMAWDRISLMLDNSIPSDLVEVKTEIDSYISCIAKSYPNDWFHRNDALMQNLRNKYLHFSSYFGSIANAPQFSPDDPITGVRKRVIQNG